MATLSLKGFLFNKLFKSLNCVISNIFSLNIFYINFFSKYIFYPYLHPFLSDVMIDPIAISLFFVCLKDLKLVP